MSKLNKELTVRIRMSDDFNAPCKYVNIDAKWPNEAILRAKELFPEGKVFKCREMWLFEDGKWWNMSTVS